ncbi:unnamed protein product [Rotaria sordida]|uniref:Uncharacterized protein n=1 Tax=Rotaria sordida TaxID=392033 RepID=A0A818V8F4_9BILA|nr:unnamed protein product [Rotaria sordida]CAF3703359.1 unnamed protein product [Rotaria sordida]
MIVEPEVQTQFERNLLWKRSWPRCFLACIATVEIILAVAIAVTEIFNILVDFWHTNIFGGIWTSIILLVNWILIFVHVCCKTTVSVSTCSFVWHWITLIALGILIAFDIVFILNPYTCLLTSTCSTQSQLTSLNYIIQKIPQFSNYTIYDSKKFLFLIQVGCAGLAFILTIIYIVIFIVCRIKFHKHITTVYPTMDIHTPKHGLRVAQAPPIPYGNRSYFVSHPPN